MLGENSLTFYLTCLAGSSTGVISQSWIMLRIAEKLDFVTRSTVEVHQMKMIDRQIRVLKTTLAEKTSR
jgi:hypothetical protein